MSHNPDSGPGALDGILPRVRVTREIPLWGILTVIAGLAAQAVALYYGLQRQGEEQARQGQRQVEMAADVRSIASDIQKSALKTVEMSFLIQNIEQRLRIVESKTVGQRER